MPMAKASRGNCVCWAQTTGHIVTFLFNSANTCYRWGEVILVSSSATGKVKTKTCKWGVSWLKEKLRQDSAV